MVLNTIMSSATVTISTGNHTIRISSVYKIPNQSIATSDLDTLIRGYDWFIAAGDLNVKHSLCNSHSLNPVGNILYRHDQQADYTTVFPDNPTRYPSISGHRPDVLDIALVRLPHQVVDITKH